MQDLKQINDATLLTQSKVYQICGTLYRFRHQSDSLNAPQFTFEPLGGQKKSAPLKLNLQKIYSKVYEVPDLYNQIDATVTKQGVQLSLF